LYDVSLTFERVPEQLSDVLDGRQLVELTIADQTVRMKLRESETSVLELVTALSKQARLLRIEINGASLEDIFVELTLKAGEQR
jgi:hypothetical protein